MSVKIILIGSSALFALEHISQLQQFAIKPSTVLRFCANKSIDFFMMIGRSLAKISSFLTLINFEDLVKTFCEIVSPLIDLVSSPLYIANGYICQALTYVDREVLVYVGSALIISLLGYICYKYSTSIREKINAIRNRIKSIFN